jgi:hypothetical protein
MTTIILIVLSFILGVFIGVFFYAQYHAKFIADLQKAKSDAEYLLASAKAELNALKDKFGLGAKVSASTSVNNPPVSPSKTTP